MGAIVKLENVKKTYLVNRQYKNLKESILHFYKNEKIKIEAMKGINLEIGEGEIVGFIGPNGAGKSTTIKIMCGILRADEGKVELNGMNPAVERKQYVKDIGCVFGQRSQLWWDLPVMDSFQMLKHIYRIPQKEFESRIEFYKEKLNIGDILYKPVRQMSLGQRMRCEIVAAFLHNPKLVFLDEPTIGLDVIAKEEIRNIIRILNEKYQTTIILTTHDMSDVEELCKRIVVIDKGETIYDGLLEDVRKYLSKDKFVTLTMDRDTRIDIEGVCIEADEGKKKKLKVDTFQVPVAEVLKQIAQQVNILDMEVANESIESIVKTIYSGASLEDM